MKVETIDGDQFERLYTGEIDADGIEKEINEREKEIQEINRKEAAESEKIRREEEERFFAGDTVAESIDEAEAPLADTVAESEGEHEFPPVPPEFEEAVNEEDAAAEEAVNEEDAAAEESEGEQSTPAEEQNESGSDSNEDSDK